MTTAPSALPSSSTLANVFSNVNNVSLLHSSSSRHFSISSALADSPSPLLALVVLVAAFRFLLACPRPQTGTCDKHRDPTRRSHGRTRIVNRAPSRPSVRTFRIILSPRRPVVAAARVVVAVVGRVDRGAKTCARVAIALMCSSGRGVDRVCGRGDDGRARNRRRRGLLFQPGFL